MKNENQIMKDTDWHERSSQENKKAQIGTQSLKQHSGNAFLLIDFTLIFLSLNIYIFRYLHYNRMREIPYGFFEVLKDILRV